MTANLTAVPGEQIDLMAAYDAAQALAAITLHHLDPAHPVIELGVWPHDGSVRVIFAAHAPAAAGSELAARLGMSSVPSSSSVIGRVVVNHWHGEWTEVPIRIESSTRLPEQATTTPAPRPAPRAVRP